MADGALLGCPHCGKPIAFAADLAGRLAACPHCRGPFQMPATSPQPAPQPASKAPLPTQQPARKPVGAFGFDPDDVPTRYQPGDRRGNEPLCYPHAESASLPACVCGIIFTLMLAGILILDVIVPMFQLPGTRAFFTAFLGSIGVLAFLVGGIAGSLLLRQLVLVLVDAARNVRGKKGEG